MLPPGRGDYVAWATVLRYFAGGLPNAFLNIVMNAVADS